MNRTRAREYAFVLLFEYKFQPNDIGAILNDFIEEFNPGTQSKYIERVVKGSVEKIDEINPLSGLVVSASENQIYIDLGSDNGVKMGDSFIIYKEGNIIKHPVTGQIITVQEIIKGLAKVVEVNSNYALCELKKSKGNIVTGDKVKRGRK